MNLPLQSQPIPIDYAKHVPFVVLRTCGDEDSGVNCTGTSPGAWWVSTNMYVLGLRTLEEEMHFLRPWNSSTPNRMV
uniref:Uncharacterized protein n=1 Tax=Fagus sylvatica TaxID=28930 RepID=A0A2N9FW75_FAGSY